MCVNIDGSIINATRAFVVDRSRSRLVQINRIHNIGFFSFCVKYYTDAEIEFEYVYYEL